MCFQLSNLTQFDSWAFQQSFFDRWTLWIGTVMFFVFNPKDQRLKNLCWSIWSYYVNFETRCSSLDASLIEWWVPTVLLFFWDFFWRSGLSEYWIRSYVRRHCFGCSPRLGTPSNSPCKLASAVLSWSLTLCLGATIMVAQSDPWPFSTYRIPSFLPMVIKLVCVMLMPLNRDVHAPGGPV